MKNLRKFEKYMRMKNIVNKMKQSEIDKISKDKNVFGNITKGIDLGRLSDKEYEKYCEKLETTNWAI